MYGREVPAYRTLLEVSHQVNAAVVAENGGASPPLGSLQRVSVERHGAIRLGSAAELAQVARLFAAVGMHPVGYYDLRRSGVPVVSTAFRPIDEAELELNPFRVFTSILTTDDPRFFTTDLATRVRSFVDRRELFAPALLSLADRCTSEGGLEEPYASDFVRRLTSAFELDRQPLDRGWYDQLQAVSPVAADIAGSSATHINHLTPRVLDIDALHAQMTQRGVEMIPEIQGPPAWGGPNVLLRQTSFRALAEERQFREADGSLTTGNLRVRFGEVEARGIALTRPGRDRYDQALLEADHRANGKDRTHILRDVWAETFPNTELELCTSGMAAFTIALEKGRSRDGRAPSASLEALVKDGFVVIRPIVYEDFLPRSAAGIFRSNLDESSNGHLAEARHGYDKAWLESALGRHVPHPEELYGDITRLSLANAALALGLAPDGLNSYTTPEGTPTCS